MILTEKFPAMTKSLFGIRSLVETLMLTLWTLRRLPPSDCNGDGGQLEFCESSRPHFDLETSSGISMCKHTLSLVYLLISIQYQTIQ